VLLSFRSTEERPFANSTFRAPSCAPEPPRGPRATNMCRKTRVGYCSLKKWQELQPRNLSECYPSSVKIIRSMNFMMKSKLGRSMVD
jgi:hypothetical protein